MLKIRMSVSGERATKYFDAGLAMSKYYGSERATRHRAKLLTGSL
jgi:hypothetical protein